MFCTKTCLNLLCLLTVYMYCIYMCIDFFTLIFIFLLASLITGYGQNNQIYGAPLLSIYSSRMWLHLFCNQPLKCCYLTICLIK